MGKLKLDGLLKTQFSARDIMRGIERECLRITPNYQLAQTLHSAFFGSKITNPYITTDFAEAQLELITPPSNDLDQQIDLLEQLHLFIYKHLRQHNEYLWPASMPCTADGTADAIASSAYPHNFKGTVSHRYRLGLSHRYGKQMQLICGLHYNLSFSDRIIAAVQPNAIPSVNRANRDEFYVRMADNFFKYCDILLYLTGKTPTFIEHSLQANFANCTRKENGDLGMPNSLSLRNSNIGYVSAKQEQLLQPIAQLEDYIELIKRGMRLAEPEFADIPNDQQLNQNITQLPNELYLPFRLKSTKPEILPEALLEHGVEYVEIRLLDLDAQSPIGINRQELLLIEVFCLWCSCQNPTGESILQGYKKYSHCANAGCDPNFKLPYTNQDIAQFSQQLNDIAEVLDANSNTNEYQVAINAKLSALKPNGAPQALNISKQPLLSATKRNIEQHNEFFESMEENSSMQALFMQAASDSKRREDQLKLIDEAQFQQQFSQFCNLD